MRGFARDNGAGEWARTIDLLITNQLLYQLSYAGVRRERRNILARQRGPAQKRIVVING